MEKCRISSLSTPSWAGSPGGEEKHKETKAPAAGTAHTGSGEDQPLEGPAADGGEPLFAGGIAMGCRSEVRVRALRGHESSFQISMKSIRLI